MLIIGLSSLDIFDKQGWRNDPLCRDKHQISPHHHYSILIGIDCLP